MTGPHSSAAAAAAKRLAVDHLRVLAAGHHGAGVVRSLEALAAAIEVRPVVHVARFTETGYVLMHPLIAECGTALFDCPVNDACQHLDGPPAQGLGDYEVGVEDGVLWLGDRWSP